MKKKNLLARDQNIYRLVGFEISCARSLVKPGKPGTAFKIHFKSFATCLLNTKVKI